MMALENKTPVRMNSVIIMTSTALRETTPFLQKFVTPVLKILFILRKNIFEKLMEATKVCSLGQITSALFEVGGQYRRNM